MTYFYILEGQFFKKFKMFIIIILNCRNANAKNKGVSSFPIQSFFEWPEDFITNMSYKSRAYICWLFLLLWIIYLYLLFFFSYRVIFFFLIWEHSFYLKTLTFRLLYVSNILKNPFCNECLLNYDLYYQFSFHSFILSYIRLFILEEMHTIMNWE